MSAARDLANFLSRVTPADLPAQAVDHAAMLIASTFASAAMGTGIESAQIIRDMARERGGTPQASLWFDNGAKLPVSDAAQANAVTSDAAASDDSDLRHDRALRHAAGATSLALAEQSGASGADVLAAIVVGYEAAGRIIDAMPRFRVRGYHGSHRRDLRGDRRGRAAAESRRRADDARDRADRDLGQRAREAPPIPASPANTIAACDPGRHPGGAGGAARLYRRRNHAGDETQGFSRLYGGEDGAAAAHKDAARPRRVVGHRHRHGGEAGARRPPVPCLGRGRRQRVTRGECRG